MDLRSCTKRARLTL